MNKKIVGVCGLIGNGKDTAAGFLLDEGFTQISFAAPLKDALSAIFGWDRELLEGHTIESREWRNTVDEWWSARLGIPNFTPRFAMTNIGTDVMRNHFNKDIWVASAEKRIEETEGNIVISDCRFFNELDIIKKHNGVTVSVWRNDKPEWWQNAVWLNTQGVPFGPHPMKDYPNVHASEYSWAGWDFTYELHNDSTLESFREKTIKLLC